MLLLGPAFALNLSAEFLFLPLALLDQWLFFKGEQEEQTSKKADAHNAARNEAVFLKLVVHQSEGTEAQGQHQ